MGSVERGFGGDIPLWAFVRVWYFVRLGLAELRNFSVHFFSFIPLPCSGGIDFFSFGGSGLCFKAFGSYGITPLGLSMYRKGVLKK